MPDCFAKLPSFYLVGSLCLLSSLYTEAKAEDPGLLTPELKENRPSSAKSTARAEIRNGFRSGKRHDQNSSEKSLIYNMPQISYKNCDESNPNECALIIFEMQ